MLTINCAPFRTKARVSCGKIFSQQMVTPNYVGVDIRAIIQAVSSVTGRNFIIDPRVRQEVTMISSTPMSPDAFYEAFLAILEVHQLAAMQSGDIIKIIPNATARQYGSPMGAGRAAGDDVPMHIHIAEQQREIDQCLAHYGRRPVRWFRTA
mgnify:CR=1 FL=1